MAAPPKKSFGQHWLKDATVLESIVDAADVNESDVVVEVGPGLGLLTEELSKRVNQVIAIELDAYLINELTRKFEGSNVKIKEADILRYDLTSLPVGYKIVANIPYYLTSHLLRIISESSNPPSSATLLVQQEVAERVTALPGEMSLLSVTAQYYWHTGLGPLVPAKLFEPPPKVDSQVLLLQRREKPLFKDVDTKQFFRIAKAGFSQRRKKLRGSLSGGLAISKVQADELLASADIDSELRAQNLTLDDWYKLYNAYASMGIK